MTIDFNDRVAIVTGAGTGLGRTYALELARRGAKVVVNDFGGGVDGSGGSSVPAEAVVAEIVTAGGQAMAHGADVTNAEQVADMVARTLDAWGRVDVLINNAGILRDASFAKASLDDFRKVVEVHLLGAMTCAQAVWGPMREAGYGRILLTSSGSGLYGNFGQAAYGAAKAGLIGLMNVLQIEGAKFGIRVNALVPSAATRMTEALLTPDLQRKMTPAAVCPAAVVLTCEAAPERSILAAAGGGFSRMTVQETPPIFLENDVLNAESLLLALENLTQTRASITYPDASAQTVRLLGLSPT